MCLVLFSWKNNPAYRLILASNRDEFYSRPTEPASFWNDYPEIFGGRDAKAGGSWLTLNRNGRLATVTNHRRGLKENPDARTRGFLVKDFVTGTETPRDFMDRLAREAASYNGFNLLTFDANACLHFSNYSNEITGVPPGVHGLSNALLDTPWPKVVKGKKKFIECLGRETWDADDLLDLLYDESQAGVEQLPDTGVGVELERRLSSMFIKSPGYGTRVSTVITISNEGRVVFDERTYHPEKDKFTTVRQEFDLTE